VGKSALINHWLDQMQADDYRGAQRVYGWSFYSQGASADRLVSADPFIDDALRWFGDPDPTQGSPWDKGERLAHLIRQEWTLLILDGLEPLQQPPGPDEGKLTDPSLQALLRELAARNPGLCLISTRLPLAYLTRFPNSARRLDLEHLSAEAGADFLQAQGVKKGSRAELLEASRAFGGHALALTLLGSYLRDAFNGDVRRWRELGPLMAEVQHGGHARRVLQAYEQWLGNGPERAIIRLLGLFDRPADAPSLAALRAAPLIPGLTEALFIVGANGHSPLPERDWNLAVAKLRRARLLAPPGESAPDTLDAHPLVREYFSAQLQTTAPTAWREGHDRLYQPLKATTKEYPDTLVEMAPLFAAVTHGCRAGKHQEVLDEVYWERIRRRNEAYSVKKLGAFSSDLAALANFFVEPWHQPVESLTEADKAVVLGWTGFRLRALGRLAEGRQPIQTALEARIAQEDWKDSAINAGNLSELSLTLGEVAQALVYAQQAVDLADRSGDADQRMINRTTMANGLHQAGRLAEAEAAFAEAEAMQNENQSQYPLLYSLRGFLYCDLLLGQGRFQEVQQRASQTLEWAKQAVEGSLLDIALDILSLGRAYLAEAVSILSPGGPPLLTQASSYLHQAVAGLRQAGQQDDLPRGLLARAELYRWQGAWAKAQADLEEVMDLATRSGMRLFECDAHLEWARLLIAQGRGEDTGGEEAAEDWLAEVRTHVAEAKRLVAETGYHRRDGEVAELEERMKGET
jgi:tetratricopeptide (TPR) repeat protein